MTAPVARRVPATVRTTGDRYPTRVSDTPVAIDRAEPTVWSDLASTGMFGARELEAHRRDGYVQVPALLTADETAAYRAELDRLARDPAVRADERCVVEKSSDEVRSIFEVHRISEMIGRLVRDERVLSRARQILGSEVYVHQSRINYKPGLGGRFYWHSDFETWHAEDGMPGPRAVSCSISLTDNHPFNGCLMIMPGSHRTFVSCVGETPEDDHLSSLTEQEVGTPDAASISALAERHGIAMMTGDAGGTTFFDSDCMHGSGDNITPYPRRTSSWCSTASRTPARRRSPRRGRGRPTSRPGTTRRSAERPGAVPGSPRDGAGRLRRPAGAPAADARRGRSPRSGRRAAACPGRASRGG